MEPLPLFISQKTSDLTAPKTIIKIMANRGGAPFGRAHNLNSFCALFIFQAPLKIIFDK